MHNAPPPFFKQGPSAHARFLFFAFLALALLIVDTRLRSLETVRKGIAVALYPLQKVVLLPRYAALSVSSYFSSVQALQRQNDRLRIRATQQANETLRNQSLLEENKYLKSLFQVRQQAPHPTLLAETLYDARDPFSRKIILDRGSRDNVQAGQPVIDDKGVVGQVTRVFPMTAEVTLLTDHDQGIPVQIARTGNRSVAYGVDVGMLELRFMATNADVQEGDLLTTSGIDGVYPTGFPVARVVRVEHKAGSAFAHILCAPVAGIERHKYLLILLVDPLAANSLLSRPPAAPANSTRSVKEQRKALFKEQRKERR